MATVIDIGKVTSKGQVTLPADVRKLMNLGAGDKVLFVRLDDDTIALRSSNLDAIHAAQRDFEGSAESANLQSEDDVVALVKQIRKERAH